MTTADQPAISAGIYCRISLASLGDTTKVEDQERICRELAARLGWQVAGTYADNSRSAWQRNRKRPAWDRMLADVEAARLGAIVVYHGDRLIRQPFDLEKLIMLAEGKGIRLAAPTGTRDLDNPDDRYILRIEAAHACRESDNTSRRRKGQYERWRREGRVRPGGRGGRAFGFRTDGITHIPGETAVVREAAARVLDGEPAGAICRDLAARGVLTPAGRPIGHGTLRKMLARPRYAGLMPDGEHKAAWEPVLDRQTWEAVCAILDARAKAFSYATNARRYLLSGIATCSECGSPLQIRAEHRRTHLTGYGCIKPGCRKVQRSQRHLDEYVITRTLDKLSDPASPPGRLPTTPQLAAQFATLTTRLEQVEEAIADPDAEDLELLRRRRKAIRERLKQLRGQSATTAAAQLVASHAGITRAQWDDLPLGTRRALVSALWTVTVLPAGRRGPGFDTRRVVLEPVSVQRPAG